MFNAVLAQGDGSGNAMLMVFMLIYVAFVVLIIASWWTLFTKAGEPGWAAIVPIYNVIVMLKIAGKPLWWIILFFIPLVNLIVLIVLFMDLAKAFGKGSLFGIGLLLLGPICLPILAFGDSKYVGPSA